MKTKLMISLSLLTLGVCSVAIAEEYKTPEVGFKKHSAPPKVMKPYEFGDYYKVEGPEVADRQIASKEDSDREPTSVVAKGKKPMPEPMEEVTEEKADGPKPWLYRKTIDQK